MEGYACLRVRVCMYVCAHGVCAQMWRPKVTAGCLPPVLLFALLLKTGSLAEPGAHGLARLVATELLEATRLATTTLVLQACATTPSFVRGCWGSELGTH